MCGIVGFVGREEAAPILLDGLERMEYRGYDSAGVAVRSETAGLQVRKTKGRLQVLSDLIHGGADLEGNLGIGHTRWATHGEPSDVNSHPQVSESGRFAVVHNGIIENYMELREFLQSEGITFVSQTDTEVVAQLLEHYYDGDILDAVVKTLNRIQGAYAWALSAPTAPTGSSPPGRTALIIGYGQNGNFIASDVTAVIKYTRDVVLHGRWGDRCTAIGKALIIGACVRKPHKMTNAPRYDVVVSFEIAVLTAGSAQHLPDGGSNTRFFRNH